jgi:hypothetical protein
MRKIIFMGQTDFNYGRGKDKGKRRARIKNFLVNKSKQFNLSKRVEKLEKSGLSKRIKKFENSIPVRRSFIGKIAHDTGKGTKIGGISGAVLGAGTLAALSNGNLKASVTGGIVGGTYGAVTGALGGSAVGITRASIIHGARKIKQMVTIKKKNLLQRNR